MPLALSNGKVQPRAARIALASDRDGEDYAAGLALAKALAAADPDPEWAANEAEFRYRTGDQKGATAALEALGSSGDLEKMLAAADAYARLKKFGDAARIAREVCAKNPDNTEAQFRLGSSLERDGDSAGAEAVFLKLLANRPNDAATENYLGYMWADKGVQLERAREMLEKAVSREPRNAAYLDSLGWVYFRLGRIDSAEKNLREAHRREPDRPDDRGASGRPRDEARQHGRRDPELGEGPGAPDRGARSRQAEAAAGPGSRVAALTRARVAALTRAHVRRALARAAHVVAVTTAR